ncbi:MAG: AMP-binding protein, partial [Mariprofundaceae bacterium]|nr:AMP-binding protein [Mariprofundaceae bacterium]
MSEGVTGLPSGTNDWKRSDYGDPCPPIGRHRYFFKRYAMDITRPDLSGPGKSALKQKPVPPSPASRAEALLELIRILLRELRPEAHPSVNLDSSMDRDLALDSLARIELLLRCEHQFGVSLPEQLISSMETPRELLRAILKTDSTIQDAEIKKISTAALQGAEGEPANATTLIEALEWHTNAHPQRIHVFLQGQKGEEEEISYGDLINGAEALCASLRERGLLPGQSVALMLPTGKAFFVSFYGILMAGGIPVPIYPPMRLKQVEEHMRRQTGILSNAQAVLLITTGEIKPILQLLKPRVESLQAIVTVDDLSIGDIKAERPALNPNDIALLQYTSGSTGKPKGVVLTHANILANIRAMGQAIEVTPKDVFVSWLPLYHDMGLIGACMGSMYYALPLILMSPLSFIARPQCWLWAIHKYRGTISSAPNFAYELCLRMKDDKDFEGLDLSSWRMACNGAEPVSPDTLERFTSRFSAYGFRPEAIAPVYGLAESSVGLAFPPPLRGALVDVIQREPFLCHGRAIPADSDERNAMRFVACGRPLT